MTLGEILNQPMVREVVLFALGVAATSIKQSRKDTANFNRNIIETQGQLKAADAKIWEKLSMIRRALEDTTGCKIHDREWDLPPSKDSSNSP